MTPDLRAKIKDLQGPVLVLGASGFVGANLLRMLLKVRSDVYGTTSWLPAWRLDDVPEQNVVATDLLVQSNVVHLLDSVRPRTIFDCVAYGAYPFQTDIEVIYRTNLNLPVQLLEELIRRDVHRYIHAGTSSEYGAHAAAPKEESACRPNSHYSASKAAMAGVIYYAGTERGFSCANLRFYSIYGPYEDSSRLIPTVVAQGANGSLPAFVDPEISRDFVYVDDACAAFVYAALNLPAEYLGHSFNVGTGRCVTIREVAETARDLFKVEEDLVYTMPPRAWDVTDWYADVDRTADVLGWRARVTFSEGLERTIRWFKQIEDHDAYLASSKKFGRSYRHSVSAIVACYKDAQALPILYERLTRVFQKLNIDYEIIFVNDCSPDESEEVIRQISSRDHHVIGITHSRNFGSQSAFRSGLELASKNGCVLLDGDLQDPPELIERFVERWKEGYDVVYGRRVKRECPWYMQISYKLFYRLFDLFSYLEIPHDAGDFSLMDKRVVGYMLQLSERDLLLRGVRAFVGFRQTGVDYVRPERRFGRSTNNLLRNLGWAKKGILAFSNAPLNALSTLGVALLAVVAVLGILQVGAKLAYPNLAPPGVTTLMLIVMGFGAINLMGISLLGEYIAKIFEEVKARPHFVRRSIIRDGEIRDASESSSARPAPESRS